MRRSIVLIPLAGAVAASLAFAVPASADTSGGTPVTFTVQGATLDITVPAGPVSLGSVVTSAGAQSLSAQLGVVTVTDGRGGTAGWTATASATDFTGPQTISVSAPASSEYTTPQANVTGTAAVSRSDLDALYPGGAVQVAVGVDGVNTASWNPTIQITIPADALAGTYSTTVTHSVS